MIILVKKSICPIAFCTGPPPPPPMNIGQSLIVTDTSDLKVDIYVKTLDFYCIP